MASAMTTSKGFQSGFVSIIGNANVGKSTLLNALLGEKLVITSAKPQTTRNTIRAVYTDRAAQIIFIDTPGLHNPKHRLGDLMTKSALKTLGSVDLIIYVVDATKDKDPLDARVLKSLHAMQTPSILVLNKIDKVKDMARLETFVDNLKATHPFEGVFAVSALEGTHTTLLKDDIKSFLPEGPKYYPEDMKTDQPEKFLIEERIREKVLELTQEEVPHSVAVIVENLERDASNPDLLNIYASVIVERDSQKGIIIGKGGRMLKMIGTRARKDILDLLGSKIYLDLHCKVIKDWRNNEHRLRQLGYKESE